MRGVVLAAVLGLAGMTLPAQAQETQQAEQAAVLPDWSGIWVTEGPDFGVSGFPLGGGGPVLSVPNEAVPWNEAGRRIREEALARARAGDSKADGWGYPLMMSGPPPLQFLVTPDETIILNTYRDLRHIYTDGRGHLDEDVRWPTVWGDSVGHWDGDKLVIETVGVEEPDRYFFANIPFSANAVYTERIRRVAPDRIENTFTVTDPERLEHPWTVTLAYVPAPFIDRLIHDAYTNDRSELDDEGLFTILPPQDEGGTEDGD